MMRAVFLLAQVVFKANPLPIFNDVTNLANQPDAETQCDCPETRSLLGIFWSCTVTLFICTWVSIHPNIPAHDDSLWIVMSRRLGIMLLNFLAPDFIAFWAYRQWAGAKIVRDKFRNRGWTMTHAFFIEMGGLMLLDGDKPIGILTCERLERLLAEDAIDFPSITLKEIEDRSKADGIAKAIVVIQTAWFVAQCITRLVLKLPLTRLEYYTLLFTFFNALFYFLWWYKPMNVNLTIGVPLKSSYQEEKPFSESTCPSSESLHAGENAESVYWSVAESWTVPSEAASITTAHEHAAADSTTGIEEVPREPTLSHKKPVNNCSSNILPSDTPLSAAPSLTRSPTGQSNTRSSNGKLQNIHPSSYKVLDRVTSVIDDICLVGSSYVSDDAARVPTFYSPTLPPLKYRHGIFNMMLIVFFFISFVVNLLPTFYRTITFTEQRIWLIACITTFIYSFGMNFIQFSYPHFSNSGITFEEYRNQLRKRRMTIRKAILYCATTIYVGSRVALAIFAFGGLKSTGGDFLIDVDWSSFVPHV